MWVRRYYVSFNRPLRGWYKIMSLILISDQKKRCLLFYAILLFVIYISILKDIGRFEADLYIKFNQLN